MERKSEHWVLGVKASGNYGESRPAGAARSETSAESASLFLRGDYRVTSRLSSYLLGGVETDHPRSVEVRWSQEGGAGYAWVDQAWDDQKLFLRTDLGVRLTEEYRFQYFPSPARVSPREILYTAPRGAVAFRWQLEKRVLFTEDLEVLRSLSEDRLLVNSVAKLSSKVYGPLAVGVGYTLSYDGAPAAPKIPWDGTLSVTLDYLL